MTRLLLFLLLAVGAAAEAWSAASFAVPAAAVAAGAVALAAGPFAWLSESRARHGLRVLVIIFIMKYFLGPVDAREGIDGFFLYPLANAGSGFALFLLAGLLAAPGGERRTTLVLLASAYAVGAGGNVVVSNWRRFDVWFRWICLTWCALAVLRARLDRAAGESGGLEGRGPSSGVRGRRPRPSKAPLVMEILLLALALAGSAALDTAYRAWFPDFERLYNALFNPDGGRGTGFTGTVSLGDIENARAADDYVALRIESAGMPGYLRGRVLPDFNGVSWSMGETREVVAGRTLAGEGRYRYPLGAGGEVDPDRGMRIHPALVDRVIFLSYGAAAVDCRTETLRFDRAGMPRFTSDGEASDWVVHPAAAGTREAEALTGAERRRNLFLFRHVRTTAVEFAARHFGGVRGTAEVMRAVESFFERSGYAYARGVRVPHGKRALDWFMNEGRRGHCEYFASAAAVTLRALGVPARLVVGFVAQERSEAGGYWVARNGDAHAWVEAHDGARWVLLEPTPPDGRPAKAGFSGIAAWVDRLRFALDRLAAGVRFGGLPWLLSALRRGFGGLIAAAAALAPWAAALLLAGWFARRRGLGGWRGRRLSTADSPLARRLAAADRRMARAGLPRRDSETALEFASRVEGSALPEPGRRAAAGWYRAWSDGRWSGRGGDPGELRLG